MCSTKIEAPTRARVALLVMPEGEHEKSLSLFSGRKHEKFAYGENFAFESNASEVRFLISLHCSAAVTDLENSDHEPLSRNKTFLVKLTTRFSFVFHLRHSKSLIR
jgi:hypothetical protein